MCVHNVLNLKHDTIEMTAATNEIYIGRLFQNSYLMGKKWNF